jgi:hypothetical protein
MARLSAHPAVTRLSPRLKETLQFARPEGCLGDLARALRAEGDPVKAVALLLLCAACRTTESGPYSPTPEAGCNTIRAQKLNAEAAEVIDSDPSGAERLLREVLTADRSAHDLALTREQAGKTDESIQTYQTALGVWPGHIQTIQALARLNVVGGQRSPELEGWLAEIEIGGETRAWREWGARQRAGGGR